MFRSLKHFAAIENSNIYSRELLEEPQHNPNKNRIFKVTKKLYEFNILPLKGLGLLY